MEPEAPMTEVRESAARLQRDLRDMALVAMLIGVAIGVGLTLFIQWVL